MSAKSNKKKNITAVLLFAKRTCLAGDLTLELTILYNILLGEVGIPKYSYSDKMSACAMTGRDHAAVSILCAGAAVSS